MALISKKITYDLPDEFLAQTSDLGLKGEYTYNGPDKVYVILDRKDNRIVENLGYHAYVDDWSEEENESFIEMYSGNDFDYALITFDEDPALLAAVVQQNPPLDEVPQKTYTLPGESTPFYSRPESPFPSHTIEYGEVEWDGTKWVKPYPWKKPYITKEQLLSALQMIIAQEKKVEVSSFTSAQKTKWNAYLSDLEAVPTKFADYLDTPWMVPFPFNPMGLDNWSSKDGNLFGNDNKAEEQKVEKPQGPVEYVDGVPYQDGVKIEVEESTEVVLPAPEESVI
jgi:hypothetical protein